MLNTILRNQILKLSVQTFTKVINLINSMQFFVSDLAFQPMTELQVKQGPNATRRQQER